MINLQTGQFEKAKIAQINLAITQAQSRISWAFVQSIPYTSHKTSPFPIETLVEGGVCADKSILYATLIDGAGI
jgi:transglutaminase-like putative cysteine protease